MDMKKALVLLALSAALGATAQNVRFEVGGGIAKHYGPSRFIGAYKFGVAYEHEFDQHWTVSPGLFFSGKGWRDPNVRMNIIGEDGLPVFGKDGKTPLTRVKSVSSAANYLELPVVFNYYLRTGERRYLVFGAGPYAAYGVAGMVKVKGDADLEGSQRYLYRTKTFDAEGAHRFDAGVVLRAGYQFSDGFILGVETDLGLLKTNASGGKNAAGFITLTYRLGDD